MNPLHNSFKQRNAWGIVLFTCKKAPPVQVKITTHQYHNTHEIQQMFQNFTHFCVYCIYIDTIALYDCKAKLSHNTNYTIINTNLL